MSLTPTERTRQIAFVLWITLLLNWLVSFLKIALGLWTQCMVITADGVHSLADGASNIVGLVAIYFSGRPADKSHPYGHRKYEAFAALLIAVFLIAVAGGILKEAIWHFIHPQTPEVNWLSFTLMGITLVVNIFVVVYERQKGRTLQSEFLISDAQHTLTDIFVTLSVIIALFGIYFKLPFVDSLFSAAIAGFIILTAVRIMKQTSDVLCDHAVVGTDRIEKIVRGIAGVRDCHEIRTRGSMDDIHVDLHVLVDADMTVADSHRLANRVERDIRKAIQGVADVVVHVEPVSHEHEELTE